MTCINSNIVSVEDITLKNITIVGVGIMAKNNNLYPATTVYLI